VISFVLTNSPATFMDFMNRVFMLFLQKFTAVSIDDILTYSKTEEHHIEHLRIMFQSQGKHKVYTKLSKCDF